MFEGETIEVNLLEYIKAHNITFTHSNFTVV